MDYQFQKREQDLFISGSNRCYMWRVCVCVWKASLVIFYFSFTHTHSQLHCCFCGNLFFSPFCIHLHKDTSQVWICLPSALKNFISTCTHTHTLCCLYAIYFTGISVNIPVLYLLSNQLSSRGVFVMLTRCQIQHVSLWFLETLSPIFRRTILRVLIMH